MLLDRCPRFELGASRPPLSTRPTTPSSRAPHVARHSGAVLHDEGHGLTRIALRAATGITVNAYLLQRAGHVALIDTGYAHTSDALVDALQTRGVRPEDVETVLFTHTHEDHVDGAFALRERWSPQIFAWEGSVPLTHGYHPYYNALEPWDAWLLRQLGDDPASEALRRLRVRAKPEPIPPWDHALPGLRAVPFGARVLVGDLEFECLDGRGHDPFHAGWWVPQLEWLFGGDAVLHVPTPILPPMRDDLPAYRASLLAWRSRFTEGVLLPGHGRATDGVSDAITRSIRQVCALHDVVQTFAGGAPVHPAEIATTWATGGAPSPARLAQAFVALGAVTAHLEELERHGRAERVAARWHVRGPLPESAGWRP